MFNSPPKHICIIRLSHIGDTCHTLAVIRSIQDYWPSTKITWIIGKVEVELMQNIPDINFIIFDKNKGLHAYKDIKNQLKNIHFDIALCLHASMRANPIYRLLNTPILLGFDFYRAKDWQWLFTNCRIKSKENAHIQDSMLAFTKHIGIPKSLPRWDIPIPQKDLSFAMKYTNSDQRILTISPCSTQRLRNYRNWHPMNYANITMNAQKLFNCKVILTGGNSLIEKKFGHEISRLCNGQVTNLIGKTNLRQLAAIINHSDILISPDSGPVHIANALGTPVIGLYATSNPNRTGPYNNRHLVVNAYPEAVKHFLGKKIEQIRFGKRVRSPGAMALIKTNDVLNQINKVFYSNNINN